ncbi:ABC transporter substrate-binding protein [Desulfatitalea alkaliphila]|uniref:ABC transport system substrate-binding protein n=1 Tax=Desulfatitalea alkaliphila TaxID=2929485 RepID=A0AA41UH97_9BACT|nr:ABC transporter substrate binding protein [Desulfatitalea alkaliphila]MCJ8499380.1 hypothetical protein [Desulfatitalea alkaliphila]
MTKQRRYAMAASSGRTAALRRPVRILLSLPALLLLIPVIVAGATAVPPEAARISVVVSSNLKPYMETLQGLEAGLQAAAAATPTVHFLDPLNDPSHTLLAGILQKQDPDLLISVGPEAMAFCWNAFADQPPPMVYSMVLHPHRVVPEAPSLCGISLSLAPDLQLRHFQHAFPRLERLGLIFDPAHNEPFAVAAATAAERLGITLVPLAVRQRQEIPSVLDRHWHDIEALWVIPDATVISESLVHFIIKRALTHGVPVFGYNQFFADSGAALALVCDYEAIGRQAAEAATALLQGRPCPATHPAHEVVLNERVLQALGMTASPPPDRPGEAP